MKHELSCVQLAPPAAAIRRGCRLGSRREHEPFLERRFRTHAGQAGGSGRASSFDARMAHPGVERGARHAEPSLRSPRSAGASTRCNTRGASLVAFRSAPFHSSAAQRMPMTGLDTMQSERHKIRVPDTPTCVIDSSARAHQTSAELAQRSAGEVRSGKRPGFIMPMPRALTVSVLPAPPRAQSGTLLPPQAMAPAPAAQAAAEPRTPAQAIVRPASLPASLSPVTNVPRPKARSARLSSHPVSVQASRAAALPPASSSARSTPVSPASSRQALQWARVIPVGNVSRPQQIGSQQIGPQQR